MHSKTFNHLLIACIDASLQPVPEPASLQAWMEVVGKGRAATVGQEEPFDLVVSVKDANGQGMQSEVRAGAAHLAAAGGTCNSL